MLAASIRTLASLLFTVVICVSFLTFLTASKIQDPLLVPSFYTKVFEENESYESIQVGVISEIGSREEISRLRDDLGMDVDKFESLARDVIPIPYLETQIDGIIAGVISYFRDEVEDPQLFVELAHSIESMRQVSLDYVERRIQSVGQTYPTTSEEYARQVRDLIVYIENGTVPPSVPSLANVPQPAQESALDQVLPVLSRLEPQVAASLEANWDKVRTIALGQSDSREAMKLAARSVASPYVDEAVAEIRVHLDDQDRFDIVEAAAKAFEMTHEEFLAEIDSVRAPISALHRVGPTVALVIMAITTILLALVNMPHRVAMILWPSIVLILTGTIAIVVSLLLPALIPPVSHEVCGDAANFACEPMLDILRELRQVMAEFPVIPSITLILIGSPCVAAAAILTFMTNFGGKSPGAGRPTSRPGAGSQPNPKRPIASTIFLLGATLADVHFSVRGVPWLNSVRSQNNPPWITFPSSDSTKQWLPRNCKA